jgi:hypothetical protein
MGERWGRDGGTWRKRLVVVLGGNRGEIRDERESVRVAWSKRVQAGQQWMSHRVCGK